MYKFIFGIVFGFALSLSINAFGGLGSFINGVGSLFSIKKNLGKDVSDLRRDAKNLYSSKNDILLIKAKLDTLLKRTKSQVSEINKSVTILERNINSTKAHIDNTSKDIKRLDSVTK